MMLMVHSVMMMMMPFLLGMMLGVMLAATMWWISMVNHVDAVAGWLASPDLDDATLGDTYLLAAALMMMTRRQTAHTVARRFSRHRRCRFDRRLFGVVPLLRIFQSHVALVVDVHGKCHAMMRHYLHGGADGRHCRGRIELHQGSLQLEGVHLCESTWIGSPLSILTD